MTEPIEPSENEQDSNIDKLEESIYSRKSEPILNEKRSKLEGNFPSGESQDWSSDDTFRELIRNNRDGETKSHPFFKKLLLISLGFFVIAISAATFLFFSGGNKVSSKNVDISVAGPLSVASGSAIPIKIIVTNNNNVPLQSATILVEYPLGTRTADNINKELTRYTDTLGEIKPGQNATKNADAILFGEKNSIQSLKITVQYKIPGSTATFSKIKQYDISIEASPVIMTVDYPHEVTSNQDIELAVKVASNSTEPLETLLVTADYPFGFVFASSSPAPAYGTNVWRLNDLKPSDDQKIFIRGRIQAQTNEERTFTFRAGIPSDQNENSISATLVSILSSIAIKQPFIGLTVDVNGQKGGNIVSKIGAIDIVKITWTNNLSTSLHDTEVLVHLSGAALDRSSVIPDNSGFYRSIDNTISWNKNGDSKLAELNPGGSGDVNFRFSSIGNQVASSLRNPQVELDIKVTGTRIIPSFPPEVVSANIKEVVKISSNLTLNSRIVYSTGPFVNRGPIPPKAEQLTSYTIIWSASNSFNNVTNAKVKGVLPAYVEWKNITAPKTEKISYNNLTREVTWSIGDIKAGVGVGSTPRQVQFQVEFLPSLGQVGSSPAIVEVPTLSGTDTFANVLLEDKKSNLTTALPTDPAFRVGDDKVTK